MGRKLLSILTLVPALLAACGDEIVANGLSDEDRAAIDGIVDDVDSLKEDVDTLKGDSDKEPDGAATEKSPGFEQADRDALTGLAEVVEGAAGASGGFEDADRDKLDEIVDRVTPAKQPDLSKACDSVAGGLEVMGEDGNYMVRFVSSEPAVHDAGMYEWAVQVLDPDHEGVRGAQLKVEPWMADHDHGTDTVTVTDSGSSGVYTLSDMNLFMNGLWQVRMHVKAGDKEDRVTINTCLAEAPTQELFSGRAVYVFSADGDDSYLTVIDMDTMKVSKEMKMEGVGWSDAIASPDGSRVFVNDRANGQVHVFDTAMQHKTATLDVGAAPVHMFNPNHGNEMWTHSDAMGAFFVIDVDTLAVEGPVTAALGMTGHGKLLYDPAIAPSAYATNVADAAAFPVDLAHKTVGYAIKLCESDAPRPCESVSDCDDAGETCEGDAKVCSVSTHKVGGTHDKAISPHNGYAYFQCSGGTPGYAVVDTATNEVVSRYDENTLSGSAAQSADHRYIFLADGDDVHVLDTLDDGDIDDATTPNVTLTMGGTPSPRGIHSWVPGGNHNDMKVIIPQTSGTEVWIVNMPMVHMFDTMPDHARTIVDVGALTAPVGAAHFSRRGMVAGHHFFTMSDAGVVPVNLKEGTADDPIAIKGTVSRFAFADNSAGVSTEGGAAGGDHSQH